MNEQNINLVENFFRSFKCEIEKNEKSLVIKSIPEKMQNIFKLEKNIEIYLADLNENSILINKIKDYLKNKSSKTLLKIDFEFPQNIQEKFSLRNCSISKIEKKHENNYFSRFGFLTTFRYLNKIEQTLNEIFVHQGDIVSGDLKNYNISDGNSKDASIEHLEKDYHSAKEKLKEIVARKTTELSESLEKQIQSESERIKIHYLQLANEIKTNKERLKERISEAEKLNDSTKIKKLKETLEPLELSLKKIETEENSVLQNETKKYSLDIENKLVNTTIIYYPLFNISLELKTNGFAKKIEIKYNPLKEEITNLFCNSCHATLEQINLCHGGHICCSSCLHLCAECGKRFCRMCFVGLCNSCSKIVCKNCAKTCTDCKKLFCKNCMRKSSLTGIEKCQNCISYCSCCSEIIEKKNLVRNNSGNLVCKKCFSRK